MKRVYGKSNKRLLGYLFNLSLIIMLTAGGQSALAETLGIHGDWSAFKTAESNSDVCYIGSEPQKAEGDYTQRGETYVLVTQRPGVKELDVVSIRAGYNYRQGSEVFIKIGGSSFTLFTSEGHAWARDTETDRELVKAMQRGNKMVVKGTSWRGTVTTDTYSLKGFTAAYKASRTACGLN